jgi:sulfatase maturation enzyme AslB (radical SAM superfamily)
MRYFALHQDVYFETGARGGALYDFMSRRVEPLSPADTAILEQLERAVPVDDVPDADPLVRRLCDQKLGTRCPRPARRDRYMPVLKLKMTGLVEPPLVIAVLHLSLTASCTLSCTGCGHTTGAVWQGCNGCARWPGVRRDAAWTHTAIDQFFDDLGALDVRNVFFSGGDPLAELDLLDHAVRRLRQRPKPPGIIVTTNGTAVPPAVLDWVAENGVKLNFVLLGQTAADYERACGDASAFDAVMEAIGAAQLRSIPFNVTLRLDGDGAEAASTRRQWASTLGAQRVFGFETLRVQDDGGVAPAVWLPTTGPARVPRVGPEQFFARRDQSPCLSGTIAVGADLSARPCPMIEDRDFGHVGLTPLHTLLGHRRHERYWQLTKADIPGCSACEFRYACVDCAAVDLAKRREPALHAAVCSYDPAQASWRQ